MEILPPKEHIILIGPITHREEDSRSAGRRQGTVGLHKILSIFSVRVCLAAVLAAAVLVTAVPAGWAQNRPMSFIRDAEIEFTIATYAQPVFQAAGISPDSVTIIIVDDPSLNAFVAGGQNLFLHTGLLIAVTDPTQLIGVIAHEGGHIAGGHLARGALALEEARNQALIGTILGLAAAVATGEPGLAGAAIGGTQSMAQRGFLSFTRGMENAADQAALSYLDRASISSRGLATFLETLADQELVPESRQVEYVPDPPLDSRPCRYRSRPCRAVTQCRSAVAGAAAGDVSAHAGQAAGLYAAAPCVAALRRAGSQHRGTVRAGDRALSPWRS